MVNTNRLWLLVYLCMYCQLSVLQWLSINLRIHLTTILLPLLCALWTFICVLVCVRMCKTVCLCVFVHVRQRAGGSTDSLFADRNEHAIGRGMRRVETGVEESGTSRRQRRTREEKHIGNHLFITFLSTAKEREREMRQMKTARLRR